MGLSKRDDLDEEPEQVIERHNPDDERAIGGVGEDKIKNLYEEQAEGEVADPKAVDKMGQSFNK